MYQKVLVPVDGSATSELGLQEAMKLARLTGASVRLLHVVDVLSLAIAGAGTAGVAGDMLAAVRESGRTILRRAEASVQAAQLTVDTVLHENTSGRVAEIIADEVTSWGADLVVLGTHGRRGLRLRARRDHDGGSPLVGPGCRGDRRIAHGLHCTSR